MFPLISWEIILLFQIYQLHELLSEWKYLFKKAYLMLYIFVIIKSIKQFIWINQYLHLIFRLILILIIIINNCMWWNKNSTSNWNECEYYLFYIIFFHYQYYYKLLSILIITHMIIFRYKCIRNWLRVPSWNKKIC